MDTLKVRDTVFGPGRPRVAVPLTGKFPEEIIDECEAARDLPCDVIEWRADCYIAELGDPQEAFNSKDTYLEMLKILDDMNYIADGKPVIFTVRSREHGGAADLTQEQIDSVTDLVCESKLVDIIDVELPKEIAAEDMSVLSARVGNVHRAGMKAIMSYHETGRMMSPEEILEKIGLMQECGADIFKIAAMAYSKKDAEDMLKMTAFLHSKGIGPIIMIAMGEWGKGVRVAAGKYGSCMTFAAGKSQSAPGQPDAHTMKKWLDSYYGDEK